MTTARAQFPDESSRDGEFRRQDDAFREMVAPGDAAPGRYHLYVSLACPWAHRTIIVRRLLGLDRAVGLTVVAPVRDERGWAFSEEDGGSRDPVNGFAFLRDAYQASDASYRGRWTVPVLWDKHASRIVNNSEDDICRMFATVFARLGSDPQPPDLFPHGLATEQNRLSSFIHNAINNGVYRAGFATTQSAYETACRELFAALDEMEDRLGKSRYLLGNRFVETDWRLFCTLIRFDAVYHGHFKCNVRRIVDHPNLYGYLRDLYQHPGIRETVDFDHIKRHYYITHTSINPTSIVPVGPELDLDSPPARKLAVHS